jgi:hypothetical protein
VLDLKNSGNSNLVLRLAECENCKGEKVESCENCEGRYITLSHCWGDVYPLCTERNNIEKHLQGIKYDDLQQTFKDAVDVTRALGVDYLWIDSLCIIQDDDDWRKEAENMEKVFASAYCTIAATCAENSEKGFLKRPSQQYIKLENNSGGASLGVYIADGGSFRDVGNGLLNKRGWTFQERALSSRTIHFTTKEVYWECGSVIHCENLTRIAK